MDGEVKRKWVEALRSGDFEQARHTLRTKDGAFCCLGVLCDVAGAKWLPHDDEQHPWLAKINGEADWGDLPHGYRERVGIRLEAHNKLIQMNDEGASFAMIADYIDANL